MSPQLDRNFPLELGRGRLNCWCMHETFCFITTLPCLSEKPGLDSKGSGVIYIKMHFKNKIWSYITLKKEHVLWIFPIFKVKYTSNLSSKHSENNNMKFCSNRISRNYDKDANF